MRAAGLELGARRAVFVRARVTGGRVALDDAAIIPLEGVHEADAAGEGSEGGAGIDEEDRAGALGAALAELGIRAGPVRLGASGKDAIIRYLNLPPVPRWRLQLLLDDEVQEVADKAGEPLASDWRRLPIPEELRRGDADDDSVLIALAKEVPLEARFEALKGVGLEVAGVAPTAVALFDAWVGLGNVDPGTTVVVYAGAEATELAITREGALLFAKSLPALPGLEEGRTTAAVVNELSRAISGSVAFAASQLKLAGLAPEAVEVAGPLAEDDALLAALGKALKCEARAFDPLERLSTDGLGAEARAALEGRGGELAVALGLALAGGHPRTLALDLVPATIRRKREFVRRTVWMYAAAAALAIGLAGSVGGAWIERGAGAARSKKLKAIERGLEERLAEVEAVEAESRRLVRTLNGLSERTQAGEAALWLLGTLRRVTPARVTLSSIALEAGASASAPAAPARGGGGPAAGAPAAEGAAEIAFKLDGEVDNARGDAAARLAALERALREGERVTLAKVAGTPSERPGGLLAFTLTVKLRAARAREEL